MESVYKLAEKYHLEGNNCVESVVKACNDSMNLNLPDVAIRMACGLGGGIGRRKDLPKTWPKSAWPAA